MRRMNSTGSATWRQNRCDFVEVTVGSYTAAVPGTRVQARPFRGDLTPSADYRSGMRRKGRRFTRHRDHNVCKPCTLNAQSPRSSGHGRRATRHTDGNTRNRHGLTAHPSAPRRKQTPPTGQPTAHTGEVTSSNAAHACSNLQVASFDGSHDPSKRELASSNSAFNRSNSESVCSNATDDDADVWAALKVQFRGRSRCRRTGAPLSR